MKLSETSPTVALYFRVPESMRDELREHAARLGVSLASLEREAIAEKLERLDKQHDAWVTLL